MDILFLPLQSQFVSFNLGVSMLFQIKKKAKPREQSISDPSNGAEKYIKIMSYALLISFVQSTEQLYFIKKVSYLNLTFLFEYQKWPKSVE